MLYRFRVSSDAQIRSVFVKVPLRMSTKRQTKGSVYEKPVLFPKTEPRDMHWLQYTALRTIHEYFTGLDKNHLGAIRVLDYLPQYHAIFTEDRVTLDFVNFFSDRTVCVPHSDIMDSLQYSRM